MMQLEPGMPPRELALWAKEVLLSAMDDCVRELADAPDGVGAQIEDQMALKKQRNRVAKLFGLSPMTDITVIEDYEVVTAAGVVMRTSDDEERLRDWLRERRDEFPGAYVGRRTTTIVRERIYKPRLRVVG